MGDIMSGLDAEAYDLSYKDSQLLGRIASYFRPQLRTMVLVALLIVLNAGLMTVYPILISNTLDTLVISRVLQTALVLIGLILTASVLSWTCNLFRLWLTARVIGNVTLQLREDAFKAVMQRDMSFFDEFPSGSIVSRVSSDTDSFASVVTLTLDLLSQSLLFLPIVIVLFVKNAYLALLTFTILPAVIVVVLGFRFLARHATRRVQRSLALVNTNVQEVIRGITVAKNFRQERNAYETFKRVNWQSYRVNLRSLFIYSNVYPAFSTIANLGTIIVVYFGGLSVLNHTITLGDWFLFVQSIGLLWTPLTSIASFWGQFQLGLSASERVFALLDAEPRVHQVDQQPVPNLEGKIDFKNVFFSYDYRQTVLAGFNLSIKAGEKVAFVGHTGAGKSSLARLIARFYEFQGGNILIDGRDIRTFDLRDYHRHLGIVPQIPFLFSGTIAENIRYARSEATDEEIASVAQHIGGGDWVRALPDGLHTQVGEAGKLLSMGQRQLVALARVFLQNPSIIIFDEATASIDPLTESQIQEGLDLVLNNRTAILVAHRLSTIIHADRIIVLSHGRIVEEGNHNGLMRHSGYYAHLYNTYFRHQSLDYRPGEGFVPVRLPIEDEEVNGLPENW